MAKKFAEPGGLNLTQVNNDVLDRWRKNNIDAGLPSEA